MSKIARARVKIRRFKDSQQDKKIKKLQMQTNAALKKAERNEALIAAREKTSKARDKELATKQKLNTARANRNAAMLKSAKKAGKSFLKSFKQAKKKYG